MVPGAGLRVFKKNKFTTDSSLKITPPVRTVSTVMFYVIIFTTYREIALTMLHDLNPNKSEPI